MRAEARMLMGSSREAKNAARAMSVGERPGERSVLSASAEKDTLVLRAEASDLGALRAVLNSALREAKIASDCML